MKKLIVVIGMIASLSSANAGYIAHGYRTIHVPTPVYVPTCKNISVSECDFYGNCWWRTQRVCN